MPAPSFMMPTALISLHDSSKSNPRGPRPRASSMIPLSGGPGRTGEWGGAAGRVVEQSSHTVQLCVFTLQYVLYVEVQACVHV